MILVVLAGNLLASASFSKTEMPVLASTMIALLAPSSKDGRSAATPIAEPAAKRRTVDRKWVMAVETDLAYQIVHREAGFGPLAQDDIQQTSSALDRGQLF
ncbi:hypothetical protein NPRO_21860 [Candidatus Nitrosymbiomonas proteolyticus]|uniref:Uncharacterized protein n=1 Tax=Candidatus Nitrosymbiomonas proteolyticus TaxID=2608984 RepID=A0A809SAW6_9BACT|nr:hypothetical protein NPRO_21860 [Candidatus Nitrosymbiomonas proteolyticus]